MFSGKSSLLLSVAEKMRARGVVTHAYKPNLDTRDGMHITTHSPRCQKLPARSLDNLTEVPPDCLVIIDEAQFQIEQVTRLMRTAPPTTYILVAVLSGTYRQRGWDGIGDLLAAADHIIHAKAECSECGDDAPFTVRTVDDDTLVLCGAANMYQPRCRKHLPITAESGCM